MQALPTLALALVVAGCASTVEPRRNGGYSSTRGQDWATQRDALSFDDDEPRKAPYHMQGMLGVMDFDDIGTDIDGATEADAPTLPLLGGAVQYPMAGGGRARLGLEAGMTFAYDGDTDIFFVDNGTAVVRSEDRLFVTDLFFGPYADVLFDDAWRIWAGAGPLIQYGSIDTEYDDGVGGTTELDDDGFGLGWHVRAGFELRITRDLFIGLGARYVDSQIDFGAGIGDLDFEALQYALTVTSGF